MRSGADLPRRSLVKSSDESPEEEVSALLEIGTHRGRGSRGSTCGGAGRMAATALLESLPMALLRVGGSVRASGRRPVGRPGDLVRVAARWP